MEKEEKKEEKPVKWAKLRKAIRNIIRGKFFPRQFFINHWGLALTLITIALSCIAHRNMYMIQINKINKLEEEYINRHADRMLLQYEYNNLMNIQKIEQAVSRQQLPLHPVTEPNDIITMP